MRISQFIESNMERILTEFEAFARGLVVPGSMDIAALRDHAAAMLKVIAKDLETPQTKQQGSEKAMGHADSRENMPATPAQEHGIGRATSGFTFVDMVSEYRALRASVIRLWCDEAGAIGERDMVDVIRFNEAIDQALAESTARFTAELDRTRDTYLGILGHDLRSPLGAIVTSAQFLLDETRLEANQRKIASTILSSGNRTLKMVAALLDFTRARLGVAMPVKPEPMNFAELVHGAVDEMKASHPNIDFRLTIDGNLKGEWDAARLRQVLSNLLSNAVNHGGDSGPITLIARSEADHVVFAVHNDGPPIPREMIPHIFEPMTRHPSASHDSQHLGLGLYIASQVISGHGGTIDVESTTGSGTTFTVRLPRKPA